jgi:hypothetical protein
VNRCFTVLQGLHFIASRFTPVKLRRWASREMTENRKLMEQALRDVFASSLRSLGFKGSLPHYRRVSERRVDYVSVQFNSAGGSFVVEIACAGPDGKPKGYGKNLPIEKLNVTYFDRRLRLGSRPEDGEVDHWFQFGPKSYESSSSVVGAEHFRSVAAEAASYLDVQMERWLEAQTPPN